VADSGAGSYGSIATDEAGASLTASARLRASWHHFAVCRARRQERQSDWPNVSPSSLARVPQIPGPRRCQRATRSGGPFHHGQLQHAQNTAHPRVVRQTPKLSRALHAHLWFLVKPGGTLVRVTQVETNLAWCLSQRQRVGACHL